ncbi:MAG: RNA methyltransferase [Bacilli bacterium]|nr:RNA methyltransferase [Bacilli bacterium]
MQITSLDNERVKKYNRLKEKKYRDQENQFIVEGDHLVEEAYRAGLVDEVILEMGEECSFDVSKVFVTKEIIAKITTLESPPTILALCHKKEMKESLGKKILILDEIQDPGNLGTMIRSSKAFHVDSIVLGEGCVDLYNPKVLRSTQGMIFHSNITTAKIEELIPKLKKENIVVYGTRVESGMDIRTIKKEEKEKFALIMGNEGNGVHQEILELCDEYLYIPMSEEVESLNVAIATSILLYEFDRR